MSIGEAGIPHAPSNIRLARCWRAAAALTPASTHAALLSALAISFGRITD